MDQQGQEEAGLKEDGNKEKESGAMKPRAMLCIPTR